MLTQLTGVLSTPPDTERTLRQKRSQSYYKVELLWDGCHGKLQVADDMEAIRLDDLASTARVSALACTAGKDEAHAHLEK